jgi:hypothetical protein
MQSFKVVINAKGGDCWHAYRKSVLVINGKNNSEDGIFKDNNNKNEGMITGRMCQEISRSILRRHRREISRSSKEKAQIFTQSASVLQGQCAMSEVNFISKT